jgi:hypothetical protein
VTVGTIASTVLGQVGEVDGIGGDVLDCNELQALLVHGMEVPSELVGSDSIQVVSDIRGHPVLEVGTQPEQDSDGLVGGILELAIQSVQEGCGVSKFEVEQSEVGAHLEQSCSGVSHEHEVVADAGSLVVFGIGSDDSVQVVSGAEGELEDSALEIDVQSHPVLSWVLESVSVHGAFHSSVSFGVVAQALIMCCGLKQYLGDAELLSQPVR